MEIAYVATPLKRLRFFYATFAPTLPYASLGTSRLQFKTMLERHIADVFLQILRYYDKIMILS